MKFNRLTAALALVAGMTGTIPAPAQNTNSTQMIVPPPTLRSGAYFAVDAGLNVPDNLANSHATATLATGVRCDLSLGYAIPVVKHLTIAPAAEMGILYSSLNTLSTASGTANVSGSFYQIPVMGDLIVNWEFFPHCVLYGGGGAGVEYNKLNVSGNTAVHGFSTDITNGEAGFAWQVLTGIRYTIGATEISVGYKYLSSDASGLNTIGNSAIMAAFAVHF